MRSAARPGCCCLLLPAACARSTGRAGAARTGEGGMSGIKNSTPVQRVTAPGEQGQVAHPHSAGSTPGPSRALPLLRQAPGAFASHPSVGSHGANRRAWRGVARRRGHGRVLSDGDTVHSLPSGRAGCVMRAWFFSSSRPVGQNRTVGVMRAWFFSELQWTNPHC